jgi:hypothetical protein
MYTKKNIKIAPLQGTLIIFDKNLFAWALQLPKNSVEKVIHWPYNTTTLWLD